MFRTLRPLAAIALLATVGVAAAQGYPVKPVTVVVPFTAGGPTDTVARSLGQAMTKSLGQSVVVENVGGAGGTVGATRVKNAAPDGYTVLLHHIGMSDAGFRTRMSELGGTVYPVEQITPAALASHLKSEIEKWGPVIKKAGIYAD